MEMEMEIERVVKREYYLVLGVKPVEMVEEFVDIREAHEMERYIRCEGGDRGGSRKMEPFRE